ncbi:type II toxin-antitoxin system death-on-curing family toxin [Pricia sp. S334]|uniref:Type II toxin-antitoxin system death-on-curing family toxin n=1 Tax=Pricia mediterranea TaxID=3076079 RepID=A0ABU3L738_9FLAO|nr:type II toxin-antitoxin system death-on-curing family toxin [Pricia sp. S334]MDT7829485.1 type II toxin-antitoxin system death-on-curing family toxin [Pricia sp. S334]
MHEVLIEKFRGTNGLKDRRDLESSLNRPYTTFDQKELYPSPIDKAAAILESILINHPFVDGNKRTGYVLMRLTLMNDGLDIEATQNDKYDFVIKSQRAKSISIR